MLIPILMFRSRYELTGLCTSFVAQAADGHILHGRNLDFGLFMGSDPTTHSWKLTQLLRDVLVNVEFVRGGRPLYNATTCKC
jgi:acid ceramidase|eukprot:COSAG02_NODE_47841_length_338_cov_0.794979_1_plen_81_part_10